MIPFSVSVIICTHNPRPDYLERVFVGLREQTLPSQEWELLLIDNASKELLADRFDIGWHPNARHIREVELGLTQARIRGIADSVAELLIFVDDDNVLAPDYLEQAIKVAQEYPFLGVWGGSAAPEFEVPPESWAVPLLRYLAIRECARDCWSNLLSDNESLPNGAGMCVRRVVANAYAAKATADRIHLALDRRGEDLTGSGDHALMFIGCQIGLGTGSMVALRLTHLIPARRLTQSYLLRSVDRAAYSETLLFHLFGREAPTDPQMSLLRRLVRRCRAHLTPTFERQKAEAVRRGRMEGRRAISRLTQAPAGPAQAR